MSHRYEFARAAGEKNLVLIFTEGLFESLPFEVRLAACWTGHGYGNVTELKAADRRALLGSGYAIMHETFGENISPTSAPDNANVPAYVGLRQAA